MNAKCYTMQCTDRELGIAASLFGIEIVFGNEFALKINKNGHEYYLRRGIDDDCSIEFTDKCDHYHTLCLILNLDKEL